MKVDVRGYTQGPLKAQYFTPFSKYQTFRSKYFVLQFQCAKNVVTGFFDRNPTFPIKMLGFSFKIEDISKIWDNRIP